jgi:hypothetical protein
MILISSTLHIQGVVLLTKMVLLKVVHGSTLTGAIFASTSEV